MIKNFLKYDPNYTNYLSLIDTEKEIVQMYDNLDEKQLLSLEINRFYKILDEDKKNCEIYRDDIANKN